MTRLHKKCFIASAGTHLLLAVILLVGPAFLSPKTKVEDVQTIDFIPIIVVDSAMSGGGNPKAKPPAPTPPEPQPTPPAPQKMREPDPPKEFAKPNKTDPDSLEMARDNKPKPKLNLVPSVRNKDSNKPQKQPQTDTKERELAEARRQAAMNQFRMATANIRQGTSSSSTSIEDVLGPGGGGQTYANYAAYVKSMYENAWAPPEDAANDDAITKVSVTIARDGNVTAARITRRSGDGSVDSSVQRTLDRVTFIAPFPDGAKDKERTYIINFNLKAKRGIG